MIRYQIPNFSRVVLKVFDLLGREVRTLVNEGKAPGDYEVTFDGKGLASGVYFYRLEVGALIDTKKLLLLRASVQTVLFSPARDVYCYSEIC
jgi:hypothetical protein